MRTELKDDLNQKPLAASVGLCLKPVLVLMALFGLSTVQAWSQDEQSNSESINTKEAQVKTNGTNQASAKKTTNQSSVNTTATTKKPKVFIPSEEISEDLPVSFPVDI